MLDFSLYKVNKRIPSELLNVLRNEANNYSNYSSAGYPGSDSIKLRRQKQLHKKAPGPQRSKLASESSKKQLEKLVGAACKKCSILLCEPHFIITPHIDAASRSDRKSCLTWVLFPIEPTQCAPTLFYDEHDNVVSSYTYDEYAFILDTRIKHGMINNEHVRILVQLTFDIEPHILKDIIT